MEFALLGLALVAAALGVIREHVLPRRRAHHLAVTIGTRLGFSEVGVVAGTTVLRGVIGHREVEVELAPSGATVKTRLSDHVIQPALGIDAVYETSRWSYQKYENRLLGLTLDTGAPGFDRWFDVTGADLEAARRLPARVRDVLMAHHRRGVMIIDRVLMLGTGGATPMGYVSNLPATLDQVAEMVAAMAALADDLERAHS